MQQIDYVKLAYLVTLLLTLTFLISSSLRLKKTWMQMKNLDHCDD